MKQEPKRILKRIKTYGFKWNKDPIQLYKDVLDKSSEDITIKKADLNKIFRFIFLSIYNHEYRIRNSI
jgi:hypothetical protein